MDSIAAPGELSPDARREVLGVIISAAWPASAKRQVTIQSTAADLAIDMEIGTRMRFKGFSSEDRHMDDGLELFLRYLIRVVEEAMKDRGVA